MGDNLNETAQPISAPTVHKDRVMTHKRKMPRDSKTQIGSFVLALRIPVMSFVLLLAGCVPAQQIQKTRTDAAIYNGQQRAREIRERCIDGGAMPGTTAYLQCELKAK